MHPDGFFTNARENCLSLRLKQRKTARCLFIHRLEIRRRLSTMLGEHSAEDSFPGIS